VLFLTLLWHWLRGCLLVIDVTGQSMEPALKDGDRLLCARGAALARGAIVAWSCPGARSDAEYLIKRVVALPGEVHGTGVIAAGAVWLEGDAGGRSFDSRLVGSIPLARVRAVALARLSDGRLTDLRK
jgi:signal peptidase I